MAKRAALEPLSACGRFFVFRRWAYCGRRKKRFIDLTQPGASSGDNPGAERRSPEGWQDALMKVARTVDSVVVGVAISGFVAMTRGGAQALAVGIAGGASWRLLERIDSGSKWRRVTAPSRLLPGRPRRAVALALALAITWDITRFGLPFLQAAMAVATAMLLTGTIRLVVAAVAVGTVSPMFEGLEGRLAAGRLGGLPTLLVEPRWHERRMPRLSRLIDIVVAGALLVFTLPLTVVIVAAVLIDSGRPVLYHAPRLGRGGERFSMLKFRTMLPNADGPFVTGAEDPRVTRAGRFLRSSKLDELPQVWNVLRGEMALVGPRPQSPCYAALYQDAYRDILRVRPGMTGLYQIQFRDESSLLVGAHFEERYRTELLQTKVDIDRYYVEHATLGLDFKILAWTPLAILRSGRVDDRQTYVASLPRDQEEEPSVVGVGA